jgi:tRNA pseudouridine55 synthase
VIATRPVEVAEAALLQALEAFKGEIEQVPPMHSALKHQGRPLYEYARQGIEIERKARRIVVHALTLEAFSGDACTLRVHSGKGFYVRALADDLGQALGCGAHLVGLRRLAVGGFAIAEAVTLPTLEAMPEAARDARLLPADGLIAALPDLTLDVESAWQISHGQAVWLPRLRVGTLYRIYAPDQGIPGCGRGESRTASWPRGGSSPRPDGELAGWRGPAGGSRGQVIEFPVFSWRFFSCFRMASRRDIG